MNDLASLQRSTLDDLQVVASLAELDELETRVLGRKSGALTALMRGIGGMDAEQKRSFGQELNVAKQTIEAAFAARRSALQRAGIDAALSSETVDVSEPVARGTHGVVHPVTRATQELVDIFARLGFTAVRGPEVESEAYNFDALNVPSWHPARDMQDTFFLDVPGLLMRTHTSPVQVRAMRTLGAPLAVVVPGRVYRNEATDATHDYVFDQIEGLVVSEDVSLASMDTVFRSFLRAYFGREIPMRLRPGYFPFVEPGTELELGCQVCDGSGCRACKHRGWIEFMGCGLVHRNVLAAGGVDPERFRGFAFGFGLSRLIMQRYRIDDVRLLRSTDLRYLSQF